ncbi:hypothetical protein L3i22_085840 [Actinoplanes sp. L3-i22]|nr:hypothetical protein L3i22_085840 [Actinoplanes sp. L3-i22]
MLEDLGVRQGGHLVQRGVQVERPDPVGVPDELGQIVGVLALGAQIEAEPASARARAAAAANRSAKVMRSTRANLLGRLAGCW